MQDNAVRQVDNENCCGFVPTDMNTVCRITSLFCDYIIGFAMRITVRILVEK